MSRSKVKSTGNSALALFFDEADEEVDVEVGETS
jgi:hypothetical protein